MGIGIIVSFAILYGALFFSPSRPELATYESLLATFVYPLIALMGFGLVMFTAGMVREY